MRKGDKRARLSFIKETKKKGKAVKLYPLLVLSIQLDISTYSKSGVLYHEFTLKSKAVSCPCCGSFSCNIKEYKTRKITHSVYHNRACILLYHARRYVCKDCGKLFMNPILLCLNLIQSVN